MRRSRGLTFKVAVSLLLEIAKLHTITCVGMKCCLPLCVCPYSFHLALREARECVKSLGELLAKARTARAKGDWTNSLLTSWPKPNRDLWNRCMALRHHPEKFVSGIAEPWTWQKEVLAYLGNHLRTTPYGNEGRYVCHHCVEVD